MHSQGSRSVARINQWRWACASALLFILIYSTTPQAQERLPDNPILGRLNEANKKVVDRQYAEAIEAYQKIIDTVGDELVPINKERSLPARWVVQRELSALPDEAIKLYRTRLDAVIEKQFQAAKASKDDRLLEDFLASYFCASQGEAAIVALAQRHFERGQFERSLHYWQLLLPLGEETRLAYPKATMAQGLVEARMLLTMLYAGTWEKMPERIAEFKQKHPQATGLLAGVDGNLAKRLEELVASPEQNRIGAPQGMRVWESYAGGESRNSVAADLPYFFPGQPSWRKPLPFFKLDKGGAWLGASPQQLAYCPTLTKDEIFLADGKRIYAINPATGNAEEVGVYRDGANGSVPNRPHCRFTVTHADGQLYVRLGQFGMKSGAASAIVSYGPKLFLEGKRKLRWTLLPPKVNEAESVWEGSPVVRGSLIYAAFWTAPNGDPQNGIACYRDLGDQPPQLVWQRLVGRPGGDIDGNDERTRHELIALDGQTVYFCTHAGKVVALDARTGRPQWEYRYPEREKGPGGRQRDLMPVLVHDGRALVAPSDSDRLLCLNALDGQLMWQMDNVEVCQLLGCAQGRLIATFGGKVKGLRGIDLATGRCSGERGWTIHDDGGVNTYGRGLLDNDLVLWPTTEGLHFISVETGLPVRPRLPGVNGQLAYAHGRLIAVDATSISCFEVGRPGTMPKGDLDASIKMAIENRRFDWLVGEMIKSPGTNFATAERLQRVGYLDQALILYRQLSRTKDYRLLALLRLAQYSGDAAEVNAAWAALGASNPTLIDEAGEPRLLDDWAPKGVLPVKPGLTPMAKGDAPGSNPGLGVQGKWEKRTLAKPFDHSVYFVETTDRGLIALGDRLWIEGTSFPNPLRFSPKMVATNGNALVFSSPRGIGVVDRVGGQCLWQMTLGDVAVPYRQKHLGTIAFPELDYPLISTSFGGVQGHGRQVFYIVGGYALVARDLETGARLWALRLSDLGETIPWRAAMNPVYLVTAKSVLLQVSSGMWLELDRQSGRVIRQTKALGNPWRQAPLALGERETYFPNGKEVLRYPDGKAIAVTQGEVWAGQQPALYPVRGNVLCLSEENIGFFMQLIATNTNRPLWQETVFLGRTIEGFQHDDELATVVSRGQVNAYSLTTGQREWQVDLPRATLLQQQWKTIVAPEGVYLLPDRPIPIWVAAAVRQLYAWGGAYRVLALKCAQEYDRHWPVYLLDRTTGKVIETWTIEATSALGAYRYAAGRLTLMTAQGAWVIERK